MKPFIKNDNSKSFKRLAIVVCHWGTNDYNKKLYQIKSRFFVRNKTGDFSV